MVNRIDKFGNIVEGKLEGRTINVKPYDHPLFFIFLQDKSEVMERLGTLPKVFCCRFSKVKNFINHCYHIITYVPAEAIIPFVEQLSNVSQDVVAIDLSGDKAKLLNISFKIDFGDKSDDFVYEYLKEMLRVDR